MKKKLGRPRLLKNNQKISVSLPLKDVETLKKIGEGNMSSAIRILLAYADIGTLVAAIEDLKNGKAS